MNNASISYQKKMLNPVLFKLGMFFKLPSVYFWGVKLMQLDENQCTAAIPYSWWTKNPFKSIYFAALAGTAELSTGALCQLHLAGRTPHSMLVIDFNMKYFKKANSNVLFECNQGVEIAKLLDNLKSSGDRATITMLSNGKNEKGESVCLAEITWSIKRR